MSFRKLKWMSFCRSIVGNDIRRDDFAGVRKGGYLPIIINFDHSTFSEGALLVSKFEMGNSSCNAND
jgi:hypothetical protein